MKHKHTLGDAPIEPEFYEAMHGLAEGINEVLNGNGPKVNGFCLMVFPLNDFEGRANYISNANREDIIILLKEQIRHFESDTSKARPIQ